MPTVRGSIERAGKPTISGVEIGYSERIHRGLREWTALCRLSISEHLEPGESVRLVFENGRTGDAFVKSVQPGNRDTLVEFAAAGELIGPAAGSGRRQ